MRYTVVGGGLAGLTAATALARKGAAVQLFEQRQQLGGRAISTSHDGCVFNLGPHAVYKNGIMLRTLTEWGISLSGGTPNVRRKAYFVRDGERHPFLSNAAAVATSGLLSLREKLDFVVAWSRLTGKAPENAAGLNVAEWMERNVRTAGARQIIAALIRVSTYSNSPGELSMDATARQLRLSTGGVLYLDGGWQQVIDRLAEAARRAGVRIHTGERIDRVMPGTILAVEPAHAERLTGVRISRSNPIRTASLDLALDGLPEGAAHFALGLDRPLYFSVHSQWAKLAPAKVAVVHAAKYLAEGDSASRAELEEWCDVAMPGWRDRVRYAQFLPTMTVAQALPGVQPRPVADSAGLPGVRLAGDWIGQEGMLADAAVNSGLQAAISLARVKAAA